MAVFTNYESYLKEDNIYIHHTLENAENVIIFLANQQANLLVRNLKSIKEPISNIRFELTVKEAVGVILSKHSIRRWCYSCFLRDNNTPVGTIENASYICRSAFTVRRLKEQLVDNTIDEASRAVINAIRERFYRNVESQILTALEYKFHNLKFKISKELFASINSLLVSVIVAFFHPLLGIIVAVGSFIVTLIWSVDVNSKDWRNKIADEIYYTIDKNKDDLFWKIEDNLQNMFDGTSEALSIVLDKVNDFQRCLKQTDQTKLVHEWKKRNAFKNLFQKHPSVLTYLAGTRNGSSVVKVFLTGQGKRDDELKLHENYPAVNFEFVDVDTGCKDILKNMENIEKLEQSGPEIDNETHEKMKEVIKRHAEQIFANHSSVIGIEISNVMSRHDKMRNELCIVLLCLDESILPYGESPLPENLDGYPCDIRKEFVRFGHCVGCQTLNIGCSIGIPLVKLAGSVGFFVKSNDSIQGNFKSGFLTAAHVAIKPCAELYEHKSLLSQNPLANMSHEIVHPSYADNSANVVIGKVIESFFGNYGRNGTGIDAAFIQTNQRNLGGTCMTVF
nr:uncharacterized protein LOC117688713 [Crassostrea gigas]